MNLVQLSQIRDKVRFVFRELGEAYEGESQSYIIKVQDDASTYLFWYYLELGDTLRDYQEEAEQMLEEEKEKTEIMDLIEKLRASFNEMGDNLRDIARKQKRTGWTNTPD